MSIVKPYTFVANTKARASEVNQDFDILYSQVNTNISDIAQNASDIEDLDYSKADINGSSSQRFAVSNPVNNYDAVNKQFMLNAISNALDIISGLLIKKDTSSPYDTILVNPGCAYDSTKTFPLVLSNITSKQNTNQEASHTYYVYIIGNSSATSIDIFISSVSSNPPLPSGYTLYRLIGSYTTDSSNHIYSITSYGMTFDSNIFDKIMPNYSAGVSFSSGTVIPVNAVGYAQLTGGSPSVAVNGVGVLSQWSQDSYRQPISGTFLIPKNATVTYSGCNGVKYFPLKGAN